MYQALYRKYRPRRFEDVVGQEHITETLRRQVELGRTGHAYIFVGTRGTGKTTCAKILSRALNCLHPVNGEPCNECEACRGIDSGAIMDVIEIDAASNGSVDDIRALREAANYTPADVKKRVYILDEAHMITNAAFPALLKILEEPPEHLVFILATTNLEKIPITILSRCQHFSFRRITPEVISGRLKYVASREGFELTDGAAALLSRLGDGSMRDALSLLDQCLPAERVDEDSVVRAVGIMGAEDTVRLWRACSARDTALALELFDKSYRGGAEPISVLRDLLSLSRDMLVARVAPEGAKSLLTGAFDAGTLAALASGVDTGALTDVCQVLQENVNSMKDSRDKRVKAELCLIRLISGLSGEAAERRGETVQVAAPAVKRPKPANRAEPKAAAAPQPAETGYDAPPPWEDEDIPPEPGEAVPAPPWEYDAPEPERAPEKVTEPVRETEPEPVPEAEKAPEPAAADVGGDWWGQVLEECGKSLDDTENMLLSRRDDVSPWLSGTKLTLYVRNMFVQMVVDVAKIREAVALSAARVLGRQVGVAVEVGRPPEDAAQPKKHPGEDTVPKKAGIDDLMRFDGIVKFT